MQRTGHLFRRFAAKKVSRISVSLLILAAARADAAQPILTLAMARQVASNPSSAASHLLHSAITRQDQKEISRETKDKSATNFWPDLCFERSSGANSGGEIRLIHKKLGANKWAERSMDIQAGYGRVCYDAADLKRINPDWNEPGCLYLKAHFSF